MTRTSELPARSLVRPATELDVERLVGIEKRSFSDCPWDAASFLRYDCVVAEVNGVVEGFLISRALLPGYDAPGYEGVDSEREILNLAVDPEHRRLGLARLLIEHELKRGGTFFLEVRESNLVAQRLYRSYRFYEVGRRPAYYQNPEEAAIVMRRK